MKQITLVPDIYSQREIPVCTAITPEESRMKKDVLFAVIIANMQESIQYS